MAQRACPWPARKMRRDGAANSSAELKHSRPLAISPNLEALLEFEDQRRAAASRTTSPTTDNDSYMPLTPETPCSLPPPPRTPRVPATPLGGRTEQRSPMTYIFDQREQTPKTPVMPISSSESNPYINPAPTLEDLQLSEPIPSRSSGSSLDLSREPAPTGTRDGLGEQQVSEGIAIGKPLAPRSRQFDALNFRYVTTEDSQPSFHKLPALPWAPKGKVTGSQDVDQTTLKADKDLELQTSQAEQRQARTRPVHRKMKTFPGPVYNHAENFLDMGEGKLKQGDRRAKMSSHGAGGKALRIRTGAESLGADSMFNFLNFSQALPNPDSHSFIHIHSPTSNPDSTSQRLSPEAPPNPPKYPQKRSEYPPLQDSLDLRAFPLPPTTNLLGTSERADLIRKSRKLARVFGKTPEAGILLHAVSDPRPQTVLATSSEHKNRRHSLPLTIKASDAEAPSSISPPSFMDLSDEDDNQSAITSPPKLGRRRRRSIASMSPSEYIRPETQAEEERRQRREKLARLHRFLGSRVPPSLAFGLDEPDFSLTPDRMLPGLDEEPQRKIWRRRRSSSAVEPPFPWSDKTDRIKADLDSREKAINVKRAQKMEKVFGVAPPQTLYHTRHILSPSSPTSPDISGYVVQAERNQNRTAYTKHKSRRESRPSSSDSRQGLLSRELSSREGDGAYPAVTSSPRRSTVYTHYEHSLNSLHDILDRDDRVSLAELHHYLNNDHSPTSPLTQITPTKDRRASIASSIKSDRRHSLPARTSMISINSEISTITPKPDLTDFQLRRRRAAKLTHFFGVDYRELINDVLESIETGLEHERKRGTLRADEVEDLLQRLRQLKVKRTNI